MEVVLLWLDDFDDVVFSIALVWERLRRITLAIGLGASLGLVGYELAAFDVMWAMAFSGVALGSVSAWLVGAVSRALYYRDGERLSVAA